MIMHKMELITKFYAAIQKDKRISIRHIAIFIALVQHVNNEEFTGRVQITRKKVMQYSRIKSLATYHKCMRELQQLGYIEYKPSYNPYLGSIICFKSS